MDVGRRRHRGHAGRHRRPERPELGTRAAAVGMDADTGWTAGGCRTSCADGGGAREPASPVSGCFKRAIPSIHLKRSWPNATGFSRTAPWARICSPRGSRATSGGTLRNPAKVASIHRDMAAAGADVLLTSTFGVNRYRPALLAAMRDAVERHPPAAAPDHAMIEARLGPLTITAGTEAAVVRAKEGPPPPGRRRRRV